MKSFLIVVLTSFLFNSISKAQSLMANDLKLPNKIYEYDNQAAGKPRVIFSKSGRLCSYCDPDRRTSIIVFKDSKTIKTLNQLTGFNFTYLSSKWSNVESVQQELTDIEAAAENNKGYHMVNWFLGNPDYSLKTTVEDTQKICQIIKTQKITAHLYHNPKFSFTELTGFGIEVIRKWIVPLNASCLSSAE